MFRREMKDMAMAGIGQKGPALHTCSTGHPIIPALTSVSRMGMRVWTLPPAGGEGAWALAIASKNHAQCGRLVLAAAHWFWVWVVMPTTG